MRRTINEDEYVDDSDEIDQEQNAKDQVGVLTDKELQELVGHEVEKAVSDQLGPLVESLDYVIEKLGFLAKAVSEGYSPARISKAFPDMPARSQAPSVPAQQSPMPPASGGINKETSRLSAEVKRGIEVQQELLSLGSDHRIANLSKTADAALHGGATWEIIGEFSKAVDEAEVILKTKRGY